MTYHYYKKNRLFDSFSLQGPPSETPDRKAHLRAYRHGAGTETVPAQLK